MADKTWVPELFTSTVAGVNSAVSPEFVAPNQTAWQLNSCNRGGKPTTRPPFRYLMALPAGLVQGASYFSVQGGMGVASIGGQIYRLRIGPVTASYELVALAFRNSEKIRQAYMQQTVETLVIQDGQSDAILYDGSTARRSVPTDHEVPRGTRMAYGNGRLWVAINNHELLAGDIRQSIAGTELKFTETNYLSGGGSLYFEDGIAGLAFMPTTGTSDYGALAVFGPHRTYSVRADITFRDQWAEMPGFVTTILRNTGCASHGSLAPVNQDLYWRDNTGGIRSVRAGFADESGPGNAPISREVARLTDFDSRQLLGYCPAIEFNNRLLMGSSPFLNEVGGVSWKALIALDFAPLATMQGKAPPAYDGQWAGLNITHLFAGAIKGKPRAFAIAHDDAGNNSLWEILDDESGFDADQIPSCDSPAVNVENRIVSVIESGRRLWGEQARRKRLERCDVYLADISGQVDVAVYWRMDHNQKWLRWDEVSVCARTTDPTTTAPHVWKNLLTQQRPQIKTYTIPSSIDAITKYALQTGFQAQIRLVITGHCQVHKVVLWASLLPDTPYAERFTVADECVDNDV